MVSLDDLSPGTTLTVHLYQSVLCGRVVIETDDRQFTMLLEREFEVPEDQLAALDDLRDIKDRMGDIINEALFKAAVGLEVVGAEAYVRVGDEEQACLSLTSWIRGRTSLERASEAVDLRHISRLVYRVRSIFEINGSKPVEQEAGVISLADWRKKT